MLERIKVYLLSSIATKFLFLCCFCFLFAHSLAAQKKSASTSDYILVINSYTEAAPWSLRMISAVTEYVQKQPQVALFTEHMNMLMMENDTVLNEFKQVIFEKYKKTPPRMLLLLGNSTLLLKDDFREEWGDIPIILCAENDYFGQDEAYLKKKPIALSDQIPISTLAKTHNLVLLYSNLFIRENVKLISQIVPDMKKFIFIGDKRQVNQTNDVIVRDELERNHPNVDYQFFSPASMTINQLLDSLRTVDSKTTGVLYASWFYKQAFAGNVSLSSNSQSIIATSPAPLFTIGMLTIKDYKDGMIGGYAYDQDMYNHKIIEI